MTGGFSSCSYNIFSKEELSYFRTNSQIAISMGSKPEFHEKIIEKVNKELKEKKK